MVQPRLSIELALSRSFVLDVTKRQQRLDSIRRH